MKLSKVIAKKLRMEFGDLEVIDAKEPLRLQPMRCDVESAIRKDPMNCVFARAATRQFGSTKVLFWRTSAYVDLIGFDGIRRIERYVVRKDVRESIEAFDRGEPFTEGRAFVLHKPKFSARLGTMRRREHQRRKHGKGLARRKRENATRTYKTSKDRITSRKKQLATMPEGAARQHLKLLIKNAQKQLPKLKTKMNTAIAEAKRAGVKDYEAHDVKHLDVRFGGFGRYNIITETAESNAPTDR